MRLRFLAPLVLACASIPLAYACADSATGDASPTDAGADTSGRARSEAGNILGDAGADATRVVFSACGDVSGLAPGDGWPMQGGCPKRPGRGSRLGPQDATIRFRLNAKVGEGSPVIAADGTIYALSADGQVLIVTPNGILSGSYPLAGALRGAPALAAAPGSVVVGSPAGELLSFVFDGGAPWSLVTGPVLSPLAIGAGDTVYGSGDGKLFAARIGQSSLAWTATTGDQLGIGPAIGDDGTVYAGGGSKLYALAPDGAAKWTFDAQSPISTTLSVSDTEHVCFGTDDGAVWYVDKAGAGTALTKTGGRVTGGCAFDSDGNVFVGSADKKLYALAETGRTLWEFATLGAVGTPVLGANGTVYVGSEDTSIYAVLSTGRLLWAQKAGSKVKSAPALGPGGVLVVTAEQAIVAIGR